jgi:hypothetical protein
MQFVVRSVGVTWELARRLGPYLMLEILLPGGTLLAVLLFLYRRRRLNGATGARRNALANQVSGSLRVLPRDGIESAPAAQRFSLTEISGTRQSPADLPGSAFQSAWSPRWLRRGGG